MFYTVLLMLLQTCKVFTVTLGVEWYRRLSLFFFFILNGGEWEEHKGKIILLLGRV